jgi:hypothetical protein
VKLATRLARDEVGEVRVAWTTAVAVVSEVAVGTDLNVEDCTEIMNIEFEQIVEQWSVDAMRSRVTSWGSSMEVCGH